MTRLSIRPRIGLGTAQLGLEGTREDAWALLDAYVDRGGTLIDTAAVYSDWVPGETGRSETLIGEWLKRRGTRGRVVLSTKGGHPPLSDMQRGRLDAASLRHDVEQSLRRLGTDRIDVYFLHRDDRSVPVADIFGVLGEFVRAGRIGATGVSNWDPDRIAEACRLPYGPAVNQPLGNILCLGMTPPRDTTIRILDAAAFREAEADDLTLMLFSAQCAGTFLPSKLGRSIPAHYDNPASRTAIAGIVEVARQTGIAPGTLVLAFLRSFSPRIVPLIGPRTVAQFEESAAAMDLELPVDVVDRLAAISGWATLR